MFVRLPLPSGEADFLVNLDNVNFIAPGGVVGTSGVNFIGLPPNVTVDFAISFDELHAFLNQRISVDAPAKKPTPLEI